MITTNMISTVMATVTHMGMVTGMGSINSASAVTALALDPRFDLSKAYWLVAGIAGVDPSAASIGSAAWAEWLIDGDLAHEIDAREIPKDWPTGYFARDAKGPYAEPHPKPDGEVMRLDPALVETIGYLEPYLTRTGYRIFPVLGRVDPEFHLKLNAAEVEEAFEVPLAFLMSPENHRHGSRLLLGAPRYFYEMPFEGRYIWGVTAGIIRRLYERVFD